MSRGWYQVKFQVGSNVRQATVMAENEHEAEVNAKKQYPSYGTTIISIKKQ